MPELKARTPVAAIAALLAVVLALAGCGGTGSAEPAEPAVLDPSAGPAAPTTRATPKAGEVKHGGAPA